MTEQPGTPTRKAAIGPTAQPAFLTFTFAPHILEDLGVNLYTSLPKALVEFIANAYDADAESVNVSFNPDKIGHAKDILKANYNLEKKQTATEVEPLGSRVLPDDIQIVIEDDGSGMSRDDIQNKFLVIGRRKRKGKEATARTPKERIMMGRKGLGKLAGFGIAHKIEVISKVASDPNATKITLSLSELLAPTPDEVAANEARAVEEEKIDAPEGGIASSAGAEQASESAIKHAVHVPVETIANCTDFPKNSGTRIILSGLVYDGLKGDLGGSVKDALEENFYGVSLGDFVMKVNGIAVDVNDREFAFAFPDPEKPKKDLLEQTYKVPDSDLAYPYKFRIRFLPPRNQLAAKKRGVRVYAHGRLAALPDLLDIKSSAHGFQYTSYLDAVVVADFIDDQKTDYIATDRKSLRWDTPLLSPLRDVLVEQMTKALARYADTVSEGLSNKLKEDEYTKQLIEDRTLPEHRQRTAWAIAKTLAGKDSGNLESEFYKSTLRAVVNGLGHGEILSAIEVIAKSEKPDLQNVIAEITKLTKQEFDDFARIADGRIKAIETLSKLYKDVDFKKAKNEAALHDLFENNPWMLDPTFFEFITSDARQTAVYDRLEKELEIGKHVPQGYNPDDEKEVTPLQENKRPDLTFLIGSISLKRFVIVELKAPNTPLLFRHLTQLRYYMERAEDWLNTNYKSEGKFRVEGMLIGSFATDSRAQDVYLLNKTIEKEMTPGSMWQVYDVGEVLIRTCKAHKELLDAYQRATGHAAPTG